MISQLLIQDWFRDGNDNEYWRQWHVQRNIKPFIQKNPFVNDVHILKVILFRRHVLEVVKLLFFNYRKFSNIRGTESQNLNASRLIF